MNRDKTNHKRKSLLNLLSRRSTKVEPHGDSDIVPAEKSVSVQSSPIKQYQNSNVLRRHNSSQTLAIDSDKNSSSNRFSHQFNLCCSIESATPPPPSNIHINAGTKLTAQHSVHGNGNAVKDEPLVIVHKSPDNPNEVNGVIQEHDASAERNEPPRPVFNEYQSSIAMSACRSRLRQKLLPPGVSIELPSNEQHFSSPNISTEMPPTEVKASNRSMSQDALTDRRSTASADSLAKQSLIAAQLLHLIPAERARERYG